MKHNNKPGYIVIIGMLLAVILLMTACSTSKNISKPKTSCYSFNKGWTWAWKVKD